MPNYKSFVIDSQQDVVDTDLQQMADNDAFMKTYADRFPIGYLASAAYSAVSISTAGAETTLTTTSFWLPRGPRMLSGDFVFTSATTGAGGNFTYQPEFKVKLDGTVILDVYHLSQTSPSTAKFYSISYPYLINNISAGMHTLVTTCTLINRTLFSGGYPSFTINGSVRVSDIGANIASS